MAFYKYANYLAINNHSAFDAIHEPGESTPHSGIYRCEGCGREDTCIAGKQLPPQNHHQHTYNQGKVRWRLIVCHDGNPK
jgi:hypothetical protein